MNHVVFLKITENGQRSSPFPLFKGKEKGQEFFLSGERERANHACMLQYLNSLVNRSSDQFCFSNIEKRYAKKSK